MSIPGVRRLASGELIHVTQAQLRGMRLAELHDLLHRLGISVAGANTVASALTKISQQVVGVM